MIVESSFRGWEDARIVLSERGDFYTDYRRELGEKNFLILPGVEATAVLFDDEGKNSCYNTKKQKGGIRI